MKYTNIQDGVLSLIDFKYYISLVRINFELLRIEFTFVPLNTAMSILLCSDLFQLSIKKQKSHEKIIYRIGLYSDRI